GRFVHDRLRDQRLAELPLASLPELTREVAEALERLYPDRGELFTALAHHWREAGDAARETDYAFRAGLLALQSGASREAVSHLTRALTLLQMRAARAAASDGVAQGQRARWRPDPASLSFRLGTIEGAPTGAYFRLGDPQSCREHAGRALPR